MLLFIENDGLMFVTNVRATPGPTGREKQLANPPGRKHNSPNPGTRPVAQQNAGGKHLRRRSNDTEGAGASPA